MAFVKRVTVPSTVVIGDTRVALLDVDNVGVKVEFSPDHFEQTGYKTFNSRIALPGIGEIGFDTGKGTTSVVLIFEVPRSIPIKFEE